MGGASRAPQAEVARRHHIRLTFMLHLPVTNHAAYAERQRRSKVGAVSGCAFPPPTRGPGTRIRAQSWSHASPRTSVLSQTSYGNWAARRQPRGGQGRRWGNPMPCPSGGKETAARARGAGAIPRATATSSTNPASSWPRCRGSTSSVAPTGRTGDLPRRTAGPPLRTAHP